MFVFDTPSPSSSGVRFLMINIYNIFTFNYLQFYLPEFNYFHRQFHPQYFGVGVYDKEEEEARVHHFW